MDPTTWDAPFEGVVAGLFLIVLVRSNATYWIGRLAARGARHTRLVRLMETRRYQVAGERLRRWGAPLVAVSYLTIGVQTLVLLAAGAAAMPMRRFLPAALTGSVMWALVYATVGFVGLEAFGQLWQLSPALSVGIVTLLVVGVAASLVARGRRSPVVAEGVAPE